MYVCLYLYRKVYFLLATTTSVGNVFDFDLVPFSFNLTFLQIETVFIKDPNSFKVKQYKNVESEGE